MNDGWDRSAGAWIAAIGEQGDWGRKHVLDPIMLQRASARRFKRALDVGCGEGRFCRMLQARGIPAVGIDPTEALLAEARKRGPKGEYHCARAESLPFPGASFDLVVSYLTLIDIADFRTALKEMVRVLIREDTKEKFLSNGVESVGSSPEELATAVKSEMLTMGKLIKDAGIRAE